MQQNDRGGVPQGDQKNPEQHYIAPGSKIPFRDCLKGEKIIRERRGHAGALPFFEPQSKAL